jgi:hypothetical protein
MVPGIIRENTKQVGIGKRADEPASLFVCASFLLENWKTASRNDA